VILGPPRNVSAYAASHFACEFKRLFHGILGCVAARILNALGEIFAHF
jgi:hypothetical protein